MSRTEISSPAELMELVNGFRISRIILTSHELGLFNFLKNGKRTSGEVALLLGSHPRATDRLMNSLVAIGLLRKEENQFFNTGFTQKFLVTDSPFFLSGLSHAVHLWKTWSTLTPAVAAGTSVAVVDSINDRPEEWRSSFIAAMHSRASQQAKEVAAFLDLPSTGTILDVGGGSGVFSFAFVNMQPGLKAVVFDLPNIVPLTKQYIIKEGLDNFISTYEGDYLKDDFGRNYALVFMSAIIHINSPDENSLLIKRGASALAAGGKLVILDHIMNDDRTEPAMGAIFALNMLVGTDHGDTYSETEISTWMKNAGLTDICRIDTPSGINLITGRKPTSES